MQSLLSGSNPILTRELRGSLRNARSFALIALYVAILGAIVVAQFPYAQQLDLQTDGGAKGRALFYWFVGGQAFLVLMLLPALATGALAQERERQTLEPLLLSPLTPLQIVWGKAGGVLSLVSLLLLSTLPLTSLCFLLGGVSPGELVAAYALLLGLAVFTTGFGLYCAARWPGATQSMLACYGLLPIVLSLLAVFSILGALFSGLFLFFIAAWGMVQFWRRSGESRWAKKIGPLYRIGVYIVPPFAVILVLYLMIANYNFGIITVGVVFGMSYLVMAAQWGMLQTARELMQKTEPEGPMRQKVADFKEDWQRAVAPSPYLPGAPSQSAPKPDEFAPLEQTQTVAKTAQPAPIVNNKDKETYGKVPFLSDSLNPIYAKELRTGLLGKFEYLFRFSYGITIVTEVILLAILLLGMFDTSYLLTDFEGLFLIWAKLHLALVMTFGAWFGARAIAPEREGQTLIQLLTIPLKPGTIIRGKMMAVLTFTFYVWVVAAPLAILLALLSLIPWATAGRFIIVELVMGALAASIGLYCSFAAGTVRRALSTGLGAAACLMLVNQLVYPLYDVSTALSLGIPRKFADVLYSVLPMSLVVPERAGATNYYLAAATNAAAQPYGYLILLALLFYVAVTVFLLAKTARDFRKYAQTA